MKCPEESNSTYSIKRHATSTLSGGATTFNLLWACVELGHNHDE